MPSRPSASPAVLGAALGGLAAVIAAFATVLAVIGGSPVVGVVLVSLAVLLLVGVGVVIGSGRRGRSF